MKRTVIGVLVLAFALTGCKKADKKTDKKGEPDKTMKAPMSMDRERPAPMRRTAARPAAPKVKEFKPLAKLIEATKACKEPVHFKCAEGKALDAWLKDVWMRKVKLSEADKVQAWKTAATLVLHENKMIRNFAAGTFQLDPFGQRAKISKNPKIIHVKYVKNLLKALPTLETFRSGWLMSYIPYYAPAYGLLDDCFKWADKCKNKKDIYGRILKGFPKYSRLKHFDITKKYAKDLGKENIAWSTAALEGLMSFSWTKKDAKKVCPWLVTLLPDKFEKDALKKNSGLGYYLYRYVDLAKRCKVLDSEKHLAFIQKMKDELKKIKKVKLDSKNYKKKVDELKDHYAKLAKKLKKAKKK